MHEFESIERKLEYEDILRREAALRRQNANIVAATLLPEDFTPRSKSRSTSPSRHDPSGSKYTESKYTLNHHNDGRLTLEQIDRDHYLKEQARRDAAIKAEEAARANFEILRRREAELADLRHTREELERRNIDNQLAKQRSRSPPTRNTQFEVMRVPDEKERWNYELGRQHKYDDSLQRTRSDHPDQRELDVYQSRLQGGPAGHFGHGSRDCCNDGSKSSKGSRYERVTDVLPPSILGEHARSGSYGVHIHPRRPLPEIENGKLDAEISGRYVPVFRAEYPPRESGNYKRDYPDPIPADYQTYQPNYRGYSYDFIPQPPPPPHFLRPRSRSPPSAPRSSSIDLTINNPSALSSRYTMPSYYYLPYPRYSYYYDYLSPAYDLDYPVYYRSNPLPVLSRPTPPSFSSIPPQPADDPTLANLRNTINKLSETIQRYKIEEINEGMGSPGYFYRRPIE